jgi:putative transposase
VWLIYGWAWRVKRNANTYWPSPTRPCVWRKRGLMGLESIYPKPQTTQRGAGHKINPYFLRDLTITHAGQVGGADIAYVPLRHGFLYLVAIMDWYSR